MMKSSDTQENQPPSLVIPAKTSHRSLLLKLFSLCEEMRSPFKRELNWCVSAVGFNATHRK